MSKDLGGFTKEEAAELDAALDAAYEDGDLTKSSEPEDGAKSSERSAAGGSPVGGGVQTGAKSFPDRGSGTTGEKDKEEEEIEAK